MLLHFYDTEELLIPQKPASFFKKKVVHNFGGEIRLNNAEILSWLMGLGPVH